VIYLHPHHWAAIYLAVLILIFYRPPTAIQGIGNFITAHFGDSIGVYLLHLGIGLVMFGGFYQSQQAVVQIGNSLIMTAIGILKLTSPPAPSGFKVDQVKPPESPKP
jgi:hypothetical protein